MATKLGRIVNFLLLTTSALLAVVMGVVHWLQVDWLAPVILVPPWFWLLMGLLPVLMTSLRKRTKWTFIVLGLWLAYAGVFVEEVRSLSRGGTIPSREWLAAKEQGRALRVVSINCLVGRQQAAAEVLPFKPDVVLIQESMGPREVKQLASKLYGDEGSIAFGGDTSIVCRGTLEKLEGTGDRVTYARAVLSSGIELNLVSLHLASPVFRIDFWNRGFWREHYAKRIEHQEQTKQIAARLSEMDDATPLIFGGDFNMTPYDPAFEVLKQHGRDAFQEAGSGWGNTGTSRSPLFRVDQIWLSEELRAERLTAERTVHSDHKMVVCDVIVGHDRYETATAMAEIQRAIQLAFAIQFAVFGLVHLLRPEPLVAFYQVLQRQQKGGVVVIALMSVVTGAFLVAFHNVWSGPPMVLTITGWLQLLKGTVYFLFPEFGLRQINRVTPERVNWFRWPGVPLLVVAGVLVVGLV